MKKQTKIFLATVVLSIPLLANAGPKAANTIDDEDVQKTIIHFGTTAKESKAGNTIDDEDVPLKKPTKEDFNWSIKPKLLTGVMYFKHITLDVANLSNKPAPFAGIGVSTNINNWFLNGYALDTAKTTDHIFETNKGSGTALSEANYVFQRQDYAVTIGREITDWFTDSKRWGISLFAGYRYGKTKLHSVGLLFNEKNSEDVNLNDTLTLSQGEYTIKGPMGGIGLRVQPFEKSNNQLGLTIGYGPLKGTYSRSFIRPLTNEILPGELKSNTVNTWITALNWEGELTPNLSYSLVFDYYAYSMPIEQAEIKEAVSSLKLFLNYRF